MNIVVGITYSGPQVRQLDVVVDGKPWYQELMNVASGLVKDLPIEEHYLSIRVDPTPPDESE